MRNVSKLHFITTSAALAEQACKGGVDWIQLRLKNVSYEEYRAVAIEVQQVCKKYNATLIINDLAALALDIQADGVHLGKEDKMTVGEELALVAGGYIIGRTTNTIEDILSHKGRPVSYLGLGPFRYTTTKEKLSPILGLEGYRQIFATLQEQFKDAPPIVGIGGIVVEEVPALLTTGLHGIAVSGAIGSATDVTTSAKKFVKAVTPVNQGTDLTSLAGIVEVIGTIGDIVTGI